MSLREATQRKLIGIEVDVRKEAVAVTRDVRPHQSSDTPRSQDRGKVSTYT
jgi:hypothetical protein